MFFFWFEDNQQAPPRKRPPVPKFKTAEQKIQYDNTVDSLYNGKPDTNPGYYVVFFGAVTAIIYYFMSDNSTGDLTVDISSYIASIFLIAGVVAWLTTGGSKAIYYLAIGVAMTFNVVACSPNNSNNNIQDVSVETSYETQMKINQDLIQSEEYSLCKQSILATLPDSYQNKFFNALDISKIDDKKKRDTIYYNYTNNYNQKIHRSSVCEIKDNISRIVRTEFI